MTAYLDYSELPSLFNDEHLDESERMAIKVAYLFMKDDFLKGSLVGAYSLYINNLVFGASKTFNTARKTKDLDFSVYARNNIDEHLDAWVQKNNFTLIKKRYTKNNNIKMRIQVPNSGGEPSFLNIDIMFNSAMRQQAVASYNLILKEKLNLKLRMMDRRLKDLIDVLLGFRNFYPSGITKAEILGMIDSLQVLENGLSKQNFELCMQQAESFEPKSINGISIQEYVGEFFSMLEGLNDEALKSTDRFIDGYWEYS